MKRPETARSKVGYKTMGGKKIPYVRHVYPGDYVVTTYGSQDASDHVKGITFLVKHERRGAISWGTVVGDVRILMTGRVTNKLQGLLETPEGNELFHAVLYARQVPETLTDITQLSYPEAAGRTILAAVQRAIVPEIGTRSKYSQSASKQRPYAELIRLSPTH
jgi:hypothetical protein